MALIGLNPVPQKKDTLDKINSALGIAANVLKIPLAIEEVTNLGMKTKLANAQLEGIEAGRDAKAGILTGGQFDQDYLASTPPDLPSASGTPPDLPSGSAEPRRGEGSPLLAERDVMIRGADGKLEKRRGIDRKSFRDFNLAIKEHRKEVEGFSRQYVKTRNVADTIFEMGKHIDDAEKGLTGFDDFQLIKAFNQFNDTARVTEGEVNEVKKGIPGLEKLMLNIRNLTEKDAPKLTRTARLNLIEATRRLWISAQRNHKIDLEPVLNSAKALKLPLNEIMPPDIGSMGGGGGKAGKATAGNKEPKDDYDTRKKEDLLKEVQKRGLKIPGDNK